MRIKTFFLLIPILVSCSKKEEIIKRPIYKVKTVTVKHGGGIKKLVYPGEIRAVHRSTLSFDIPGKIITSNRKEGEVVKKGETLASIEVTDYKLNLEKAKASFETAKAEFDRAKILWASEAISKSEFDSTKANYVSKRSEMEKVRKDFTNTTMKAPFDGKIAKIFVKNFEEVKANQEIIRFYDPAQMEIAINVPESHLATLPKQRKITAFASLMDRPDIKMNLSFKELSGEVDPKTRSFEGVFLIDINPEITLLPGMTVSVHVSIASLESSISPIFLPSISILADNQKNKFVWVVDPKDFVAKKRIVTVANISGSEIEITAGLKEGERVITAGANLIQEGDKVEFLEETGGL
jgi:RND family efflux transporter MFP subunit